MNFADLLSQLTLAEILTVLDGTLETPGRIVIMTSNHPEVLRFPPLRYELRR